MSARAGRGAVPEGRSRGGGLPVSPQMLVPLLALLGLVVAGILTFNLVSGALLTGSGQGGGTGPGGGPAASGGGVIPGEPQPTPNATELRTPPPQQQKLEFPGTIAFVKEGRIWVTDQDAVRRVSDTGTDSAPTWGPDGESLFFIETRTKTARAPFQGRPSRYTLVYPAVMRMGADGSGREEIHDSLYSIGGGQSFFSWVLQPDVSPDGETIAVVSDQPDPFRSNVTLATLPATGGSVTSLEVREEPGLGHNDPAWSPDGSTIAFSYNSRQGATGAPRIALYGVADESLRFLSDDGYARPAWSPDGRYIVAEQTTGRGRDVVILDATTGTELQRLTDDERSFAPVWSPAGDQIAYLRVQGQQVDLWLITLDPGGSFDVVSNLPLTSDGALDAASPPDWTVPESELPAEPRGLPPPGESPAGTQVPLETPGPTASPEP